jgi:hypothetical protein
MTAVSLILATAACGGHSSDSSAPGVTSGTITIGNLYSITGPLASELVPYGQAFNAYVAQQNAKGGVLGRKIIVDSADDQASTTVAPAAAQTLIEQKGVFALAGASVAVGTFATLMHSRNVPFISFPYGNSVVWQQGFTNMISIVGLPSKNANLGLAIWGPFLKSHGVTRLGIITDIEPGTCRTSDRISAQVSSGVAPAVPPVPHTVIPAAFAAATSIDALCMPVVTSSLRFGSSRSRSAGSGVRSRIATITSNGRSSATRSAVSAMWLWNVVTWAPSWSQGALAIAAC